MLKVQACACLCGRIQMVIIIFNLNSFTELVISSMNNFRLALFVRLLWQATTCCHLWYVHSVSVGVYCNRQDTIIHTYALSLTIVQCFVWLVFG